MTDEQTAAPEAPAAPEAAPPSEECREISQSLTAVRERFVGQRPTDVKTEIGGDTVRCTLANAPSPAPEDMTRYRSAAMSAVSRVTKRKVIALMNNQDKKTDVATEVFLLDVPTRRDADMPRLRR